MNYIIKYAYLLAFSRVFLAKKPNIDKLQLQKIEFSICKGFNHMIKALDLTELAIKHQDDLYM